VARRCLLVGQANVGKTLFLCNFAASLGARAVQLFAVTSDGSQAAQDVPLPRAREILVSERPHATLALQGVQVRLSRGKGDHIVQLLDSTGLADRVHPDAAVRAGMAQALRALREADAVLHMVDAALAGGGDPAAAVGEVDREIAAFAGGDGGRRYAVLANKTDLPAAAAGLRRVRATFPSCLVIPVSALTGAGFREVRLFVADRLT
jgi:50S ribosomal subunit-associated GTPase HflX